MKGEEMNRNGLARKMTKIVDELIYYLLRSGSEDLKVDLHKEQDRFIITIDSGYDSAQRQAIKSLERMLEEATRNRSIEEQYWELMGMNGNGYDPELQLVGMLIDHAHVTLGDHTVHIELERML